MSAGSGLYLSARIVEGIASLPAERQGEHLRLLLELHLQVPRGVGLAPPELRSAPEEIPPWLEWVDGGTDGLVRCPELVEAGDAPRGRARRSGRMEHATLPSGSRTLGDFEGWFPTKRFVSVGQVTVPSEDLAAEWRRQFGATAVQEGLTAAYERLRISPSLRPYARDMERFLQDCLEARARGTYTLDHVRSEWLGGSSETDGDRPSMSG